VNDTTPNNLGSDADALRRLADDVVRHRVRLRDLGAFILDSTEATLIEPPAAVRAVASSLRRLFSDLSAAEVAGCLRDEARRLDDRAAA
jgi:hypothetical protein